MHHKRCIQSHCVQIYKDFFELTAWAQRNIMVSLMQNPILIDKNLIDIALQNSHNNARIYFMNCDLEKIFFLKNLLKMMWIT